MKYLIIILAIFLSSPLHAAVQIATATIKPTTDASKVSGEVTLNTEQDGVMVHAQIKGLTPNGRHGFHIHENGSCDDTGKAAGGHFNPMNVDHGLLPQDGHDKAHMGDMGNLNANAKGEANLDVMLSGNTISEDPTTGILKRAIIVHEKEDDFSQPTGNTGGRIGCGIITLE